MPFYNAELVSILTDSSPINIERVQSLSISPQINRGDINYIDRFDVVKRPFSTYQTINCKIDYIKSDKSIEYGLGLLSGNSVLSNLLDSSNLGFGLRNFNISVSDRFLKNGSGILMQLKSGVLTDYNLNASVGGIVRNSIGVEALELSFTNQQTNINLNTTGAKVIKENNIILTDISFTGIGISELYVQDIAIGLNLTRNAMLQLGDFYPRKRNIVSPVIASMSLNGIIESYSIFSNMKSLSPGHYYDGDISLSLTQSCAQSPIVTTYLIQNPYIRNFTFSSSAGTYSVFSLDLDIPIALGGESDRSNLLIT